MNSIMEDLKDLENMDGMRKVIDDLQQCYSKDLQSQYLSIVCIILTIRIQILFNQELNAY